MKAADIFSTLLAEPVAPEGAASKDAAAKAGAGAFDAVLAEAVDQDAAKQEGQTPAEPKGQAQPSEQTVAREPTVAREQTIVVPGAPLSIHGSISRGQREKVVAPQREPSANLQQPELLAEGTAPLLGSEADNGERLPMAEVQASDTDYEQPDDSAAMQSVLGHVAAAIARIVAPPESAVERAKPEASGQSDTPRSEGASSHARTAAELSARSVLAANEVLLEQPDDAAGGKFVLPQSSDPHVPPRHEVHEGGASAPAPAAVGARAAVHASRGATLLERDARGAAAVAAGTSVESSADARPASPANQTTDATSAAGRATPGAAARFSAHQDGGRAAYAAQGQKSSARAQAAQPRTEQTQALAMSAPSMPRAHSGFVAAASAPENAVRVQVDVSTADAGAARQAGDAQPAQSTVRRQGAVRALRDDAFEPSQALPNGAASATSVVARAPVSAAVPGAPTNASVPAPSVPVLSKPLTRSAQGSAPSSSAMQRAQVDRSGVRFESTPELADAAAAPPVQVTFGASGAAETEAQASAPIGASARAVQAPAGARATQASPSPTANAPVRAQPGVSVSVSAEQPAPAQATQQPVSNLRTAAPQEAAAQGKQQPASPQATETAQANPSDTQRADGALAAREGTAQASANHHARPTLATGNKPTLRRDDVPSSEQTTRAELPSAHEGESRPAAQPEAAQPTPTQAVNAANTNTNANANSRVQPRAATPAPEPSAQPAQVAAMVGTAQNERAAVAAASTREDPTSGDKPRAAKGAADPIARVEGFSRGARLGAALSAYSGRGHDNADHDTRGKRSGEREREVASEKSPADTFTQVVDQGALLQPAPTVREPLAPELAPRTPAVPVAVPVPEQTDIEFSRTPIAQPQNASISLHHPDLGPIQIQVQRMHDRVEVSAVIESVHAEAVLRANESGIRIGVQQSGMTFGALKVKLRGQERERDKDNARPGQERRRRGIERGI